MASQLVTTGLDRLDARLKSLGTIDYTPLMQDWQIVLEEDNREARLAGVDGWGKPLAPIAESTRKHRRSITGNADPNAPPLIPAWAASRVIANFRTARGRDTGGRAGLAGGSWWALGAWEDVVSKKGVQFLPFHFRGEGRLPRRDLAHVRPSAVKDARVLLREFVKDRLGGP